MFDDDDYNSFDSYDFPKIKIWDSFEEWLTSEEDKIDAAFYLTESQNDLAEFDVFNFTD
jgi:hypothetical protein